MIVACLMHSPWLPDAEQPRLHRRGGPQGQKLSRRARRHRRQECLGQSPLDPEGKPALPKACYLGFTGTPLLKKEKNTLSTFGRLIHRYAIDEAVADGAVQSHRPTRPEVTRELVEAWYRDRAHIKFPERIELCLGLFPDPEAFRPMGLIVRQTRQRWGSMSPAGRLLLNRRLVQAPVDAIDYVITHELCHVAEPHHGAAFFDLLDKVMPDWERRKQRLERAMA